MYGFERYTDTFCISSNLIICNWRLSRLHIAFEIASQILIHSGFSSTESTLLTLTVSLENELHTQHVILVFLMRILMKVAHSGCNCYNVC